MTQLPFIITNNSISVCIDGEMQVADDTHPYFEDLRNALKGVHDVAEITRLISVRKAIEGARYGHVTVSDGGHIYYKDEQVHNVLAERMMAFIKEGFDVTSWAMFLDRLMANPSAETRDELYLWLEASQMPLTEDGYFLAYKGVNEDYTSMHRTPDGSRLLNEIGTIVEMPDGEEADPDRFTLCSQGLHFCSRDYLSWFGGSRSLVLKIDPADVRAIPADHGNAKGRAMRYEVIGELPRGVSPTAEAPAMVDTSTKETGGLWGWSRFFKNK